MPSCTARTRTSVGPLQVAVFLDELALLAVLALAGARLADATGRQHRPRRHPPGRGRGRLGAAGSRRARRPVSPTRGG